MGAPRADWARKFAEREVERLKIAELPVDPFSIAEAEEITVEAKPAKACGVSGMLIKSGDQFGIVYSTDIENEGFQRFSVATSWDTTSSTITLNDCSTRGSRFIRRVPDSPLMIPTRSKRTILLRGSSCLDIYFDRL